MQTSAPPVIESLHDFTDMRVTHNRNLFSAKVATVMPTEALLKLAPSCHLAVLFITTNIDFHMRLETKNCMP